MSLDLSSLNERQKQAVSAPLGPVLVLAGAGSGKTRVLAYRIAYVIDQGLIPPANILALTFTNKAAKEMQNRVQKLLQAEFNPKSRVLDFQEASSTAAGLPTMGTFHSIGARILRKEIGLLGYTGSFIIFDAEDSLKVIKEVAQQLDIPSQFHPTLFRSIISRAKNLVQTPAEFNLGLDKRLGALAREVYVRYQDYLHGQNALDFDDLLMLPIVLFQSSAEVLAKYRNIFRYILVDEYQDTNPAQYRLLKLLSPQGNLFVVGDDAQSIYGFRGSDIRNILDFEHDFPSAVVVTLEQNYRSTKNILAAADSVIALNKEQKPKTLWTENSAGQRVRIEEAENEQAEAEFVATTIVKLASGEELPEEAAEYEQDTEQKPFSILDQFLRKAHRGNIAPVLPKLPSGHTPLSEFAVLYRTHAQSRALEEVFIAAGIPYQIVGGVKFYERKEIKDLISYLRLVLNPFELASLKRVINVPTRGVGEKSYESVRVVIAEQLNAGKQLSFKHEEDELGIRNYEAGLKTLQSALASLQLPAKSKQGIHAFFALISKWQSLEHSATLFDLLRLIVKSLGFESWLKDGTEVGETRWENVQELLTVTANFNHLPWPEALQAFLEEVALFTDIDTLEDKKDAVTLMTLHSAKGLEFDNVFFVGLEEGILPHSRSLLDPSELAEEIRLAYVGLTRAKNYLFLTYARARNTYGSTGLSVPSRILSVLPEEVITGKKPRPRSIHTGINKDGIIYEEIDY